MGEFDRALIVSGMSILIEVLIMAVLVLALIGAVRGTVGRALTELER